MRSHLHHIAFIPWNIWVPHHPSTSWESQIYGPGMVQGRNLVDNVTEWLLMFGNGFWRYVFWVSWSSVGRHKSDQVALKELVLGCNSTVHKHITHIYGEVCISISHVVFILLTTVINKKDVIPFRVREVNCALEMPACLQSWGPKGSDSTVSA